MARRFEETRQLLCCSADGCLTGCLHRRSAWVSWRHVGSLTAGQKTGADSAKQAVVTLQAGGPGSSPRGSTRNAISRTFGSVLAIVRCQDANLSVIAWQLLQAFRPPGGGPEYDVPYSLFKGNLTRPRVAGSGIYRARTDQGWPGTGSAAGGSPGSGYSRLRFSCTR
jgi:hypothetical protein